MRKQVLSILTASFLAATPMLLKAQAPFVQWGKTIGGSDADNVQSFAPTPDGGYIIGGTSASGKSGDKADDLRGKKDYWIVKINATGSIEWQKTYGGREDDELNSIKPTKDGGYIVGGTSNSGKDGDKSDDSRGKDDYWILKLGAKGDIEWQKTIGGSNVDQLAVVLPTEDGGYIAGGTSSSERSGDKSDGKKGGDPRDPDEAVDYWIVKMDEKGNIEWDKTYGGGFGSARFHDLAIAKDGYLLAGYSMSDKANDKSENSRGAYDYWIIKIDEKGALKWDKTIGGESSDQLQTVISTSDGGFLLGGNSGSGISGEKTQNAYKQSTDYWLVKIKADGAIEWDKTIGSDGSDYLYSICITSDGGYLISGQSGGNMSGDKSEDVRSVNGTNYWLVKTDNKGKVEWDKTIGAQNDLRPFAWPASDGGYIVAGSSSSNKKDDKSENSKGGFDYWVVKLGTCEAVTTEVKASICEGESYTLPWGNKVTESGIYKDTLITAVYGCDSFVITDLTVNNILETEIEASICKDESYTLPDGTLTSDAGIYETVLKSIISDCDSIITTVLTKTSIDTALVAAGTTLTAKATDAEYRWLDCSTMSIIPDADGPSFTAEQSGRYACIITINGCTDTSACFEIKTDVGISGTEASASIIIYPNPAKDVLYIAVRNQESSIGGMVLKDVAGKVVFQTGAIKHQQRQINMSTYSNGLYFLNIQMNNGTIINDKIVIRK